MRISHLATCEGAKASGLCAKLGASPWAFDPRPTKDAVLSLLQAQRITHARPLARLSHIPRWSLTVAHRKQPYRRLTARCAAETLSQVGGSSAGQQA